MLSQILTLALALFLAGCTQKKLSDEVLFSEAKEKYNNKEYKNAAKLLRELDSEYAWGPSSMEALLLLAKSTLESGKRDFWTAQKDLLESIQVCDLIIIYDPIYALENEVYLVKTQAYFALTTFDDRRCDQMAKNLIETAEEYLKAAQDNNKMEFYNKNKKELEALCNQSRWYITARTIKQAGYSNKPKVSLELLDLAENDKKYAFKCPELYYRKLEKMIELKKTQDELFAVLEDLYLCTKKDLKWLVRAVQLFEENTDAKKLDSRQASQIKHFKRLTMTSTR